MTLRLFSGFSALVFLRHKSKWTGAIACLNFSGVDGIHLSEKVIFKNFRHGMDGV